jgi:hypothetical protein
MGGQLSEAVSRASDVAKGVVGVAESAVQAPIKGVKAALDGKGRRR